MRDASGHFRNYFNVLSNLAVEHDIYVSIFENDSIDASSVISADDALQHVPQLKGAHIEHQTLGDPKFGSVSSEQRVINLAKYRNAAIDQGLDKFSDVEFDWLIFWDIDANIDPNTAVEFVSSIANKNFSCVSPVSIEASQNRVYDLWALRETEHDRNWPRAKSLEPGLHPVWSTFNCFCAYAFEPIKSGIRFDSHNPRLNTWDCDTVVICENLRAAGYDQIYVDTRFKVYTR
jgi:hypothetical protein